MLEIRMNQKLAGYEELRIGMKLIFEDEFQFKKEKDLYKEIARIKGKNKDYIEKNIRSTIGDAFTKSEHSEVYYLYKDINDPSTGKPQAKEFILRTIEILSG